MALRPLRQARERAFKALDYSDSGVSGAGARIYLVFGHKNVVAKAMLQTL